MFPLHFIHSMLRGAPSSNSQALTLTSGQIIRGEVLKLFNEEQLALVRIGGVQLQAKLEAPLAAGEKSWFQVQGSSQPITLKLISAPQLPLLHGQSDLAQLLQFFGLKVSATAERLIQFFLNENLPMSRQDLRSALDILEQLGVRQTTLEAIKFAVQKGLPLSREIVRSVETLTRSPALMKQINALEQTLPEQMRAELGAWKSRLAQDITVKPRGIQLFLQRLGVQLEASLAKTALSAQNTPGVYATVNHFTGNHHNLEGTSPTGVSKPSAESMVEGIRGSSVPGLQQGAAANEGTGSRLEGDQQRIVQTEARAVHFMSVSGAASTLERAHSAGINGQQQGTQAPVPNSNPQGAAPQGNLRDIGQTMTPADQLEGAKSSETIRNSEMIRVERNASFYSQHLSSRPEAVSTSSFVLNNVGAVQQTGEGESLVTFKSFLLELLHNPTISKQAKEQLQTLVQTLQGQQIILAAEAQQPIPTFFFQAFYPFGAELRSVYGQISGKKGKDGKVDPENCRLFFHLDLEHLGETEIDVSIQSRYLAITFYSMQIPSEARSWLKENEEQVQHALLSLGYSLTSLNWREVQLPLHHLPASGAKTAYPYVPASVKGVDIRL